MRTIRFRDLLHGTAHKAGLTPEMDGLDRAIAVQLVAAINSAYRFCWEYFDWAEACQEDSFTVEDHVASGGKYLPRTSAGREMATVFGVWRDDPRKVARPRRIPWGPGRDGIFFTADVPATVFVRYRASAPRFTSVEWSQVATYVGGDVVYHEETRECYRCISAGSVVGLEPTVTAAWELLPVLAILEQAVIAGAQSQYERAEGQAAGALQMEAIMAEWLDHEIGLQHGQQGQVRLARH